MSDVRTVYQIPGPTGSRGAAGADGTNGVNAYTTTTAAFTMPAEGASVTLAVSDADWVSVGQMLHVSGAGYFEATATASGQITVQNMKDTDAGTYAVNVSPGVTVAAGKKVSPAGLQGPAGA